MGYFFRSSNLIFNFYFFVEINCICILRIVEGEKNIILVKFADSSLIRLDLGLKVTSTDTLLCKEVLEF